MTSAKRCASCPLRCEIFLRAAISFGRGKTLRSAAWLEGWLCRHKITLGGARQIFSFHIAGDIPDLQSLHLKTMDHTLSTVTPSTVAFIQHDDLRALDAAFPRLGDILWRDTLIDAAIEELEHPAFIARFGRSDQADGICDKDKYRS